MAWIWAVLSVFIFVYVLLSPKDKKRMPPGPRGLPLIGHFHLLGKNPHHDLCHLARKHGPIIGLRLGFVPVVVVSSPAAAELVLNTHDHVFASRPRFSAAKYLAYGQRNLASAPYGSYWRDMRKLCTLELLTGRKIRQFGAMREAELGLLVNSLKQTVGEVDVSARLSAMIGDMTCLMMFGRKYSGSRFRDVIVEIMELAGGFNLGDYFPYIGVLDLQGFNRRLKRLSKILDGFLENIMSQHVENHKQQSEDFVDTLMAIMESGEAGFEFDRRHVKAVLLDLFVTGSDSSATIVEWTLSELIRHPQAMKKLQKELEEEVGMNNMVEESHDLEKLEYLDFVVKETLRLHPISPLLVPHESMEDCVVDGFNIPKGSRLLVNVWAIGRDPNVWPDPESFKPERFIGTDIDLRGRDFQLIPFGSGRRSCPAMQLGLTVIKMVVAQLVHCFHWELPNGTELDMSEHFGLTTSRAQHLTAIPSYRLHK